MTVISSGCSALGLFCLRLYDNCHEAFDAFCYWTHYVTVQLIFHTRMLTVLQGQVVWSKGIANLLSGWQMGNGKVLFRRMTIANLRCFYDSFHYYSLTFSYNPQFPNLLLSSENWTKWLAHGMCSPCSQYKAKGSYMWFDFEETF